MNKACLLNKIPFDPLMIAVLAAFVQDSTSSLQIIKIFAKHMMNRFLRTHWLVYKKNKQKKTFSLIPKT